MRKHVYHCRLLLLTTFARYDQGGHSQRESIHFAPTSTPSDPYTDPVFAALAMAKETGTWLHAFCFVDWILTRLDM